MIGEPGTPVRRAALLLHAMAPADRNWVLRQLPPGGHDRLRELLRELAELGIPRDAALLKHFAVAPVARDTTRQVEALPYELSGAAPAETIAAADPARLAVILGGEPVELLALLLSARDWPWRTAFLGHLGPLKARQIKERLALASPALRIGGKGESMLLAAVQRRMRDTSADMSIPTSVHDQSPVSGEQDAASGWAWSGLVRLFSKGRKQ
jgi:hypothetical protein